MDSISGFPFDTRGCCPGCGDPDEDGVLCNACADMVLADPRTSGQSADEYIERAEAKVVSNLWSARNAFTIDDEDFLSELKVTYGDACGLESNCPLEARAARTCADCGKPADSLGYCENFRKYMECKPKRWDDVKFLRDCGVQPLAI